MTLAPSVHHHGLVGPGLETLTGKWVMPPGAAQQHRIYCWWTVTASGYSWQHWVLVTECHVSVTRACPVITSSLGQRSHYHYPDDKITLSSGLLWRMHQMKVQRGKLFFRIDSMCNSVKCATPSFMEWCHAVSSLSTLQSVQCPKHSALLISFKLK